MNLTLELAPIGTDDVRMCGWCGKDDHPEAMGVWRDIDGEGHWQHSWCNEQLRVMHAQEYCSVPMRLTWSRR